MIKIVKQLLTAIALILITPSLYAAAGSVTGEVHQIRSHKTGVAPDWVQIVGASTAGTCGAHQGLVTFVIEDDDRGKRQLGMLLSAQMAGKQVTVFYDDNNKHAGGSCYLLYMDVLK